MSSKLENDEVVLYEGNIKFGGKAGKLVLTNKNIIFQQEKGIFSKKLKDVKKILIENIKVFNDNVSIKQDNKAVTLGTTEGDVSFECENFLELSKIIGKIKDLRTDSNAFDRVKQKYDKYAKGAIGTVISAGVAWAAKNPKQVKKVANGVVKAAKTIITKGK